MKYSEEEIRQAIKTCGADYLGYEIAEMLQQLLGERRWIPVSERFPEPEQVVDILTDTNVRYTQIEYLPGFEFPWNDEDLREDFSCGTFDDVTHWIPLPPLPEKL